MRSPGSKGTRIVLGALLLAGGASTGIAQTDPGGGFIPAAKMPDIRGIIPPPPAPGSLEQARDEVGFLDTRPLVNEARGKEAAADDVYVPDAVAPRFAAALGVELNETDAKLTLGLIGHVVKDAENMAKPVKQDIPPAGTGRIRPFVQYPREDHCPLTADDITFTLAQTGSYPSTHAMVGWIWASVLTAAAPDRANALFARGLDFGESRIVCGFHYRSDVEAGRLAVAALMAREEAEPDFVSALAQAKLEIAAARAGHAKTPASVLRVQKRLEAAPKPKLTPQ